MNFERYFDRVLLINLKRRPDRLAKALDALKNCRWPFQWPEIFPAIDGSVVPCPSTWKSGGGAWGCMKSHQAILERAISDGVSNVLVLEDDLCFIDDFTTKVQHFLSLVPDDWDQLMLGGQHINLGVSPTLVKPGVLRCADCERTHCYAVRGEYMERLYLAWTRGGKFDASMHCDWIMGRDPKLQRAHKVYAPDPFLVGQDRNQSDINGRHQPRKLWSTPKDSALVINLHAPPAVVSSLREYGIHTGCDREPDQDFDRGLLKVFSETQPDSDAQRTRLSDWITENQWEVASDPRLICTVWHPRATAELVKSASKWPVIEVTADSVAAALKQLPPELRRPHISLIATKYVIHLTATKNVLAGLREHGWHSGYWRDRSSDIDNGLLKIFRECVDPEQRIKQLKSTINLLQSEAMIIYNGIPVIWHPEITADMVRAATSAEVVEITARRVREALDQLAHAKAQA